MAVELDGLLRLDACDGIDGLFDGVHGDNDVVGSIVMSMKEEFNEAERGRYMKGNRCLRLSAPLDLLSLCFTKPNDRKFVRAVVELCRSCEG